jgi:hypothetical protein
LIVRQYGDEASSTQSIAPEAMSSRTRIGVTERTIIAASTSTSIGWV